MSMKNIMFTMGALGRRAGRMLGGLRADESGQDLIEYALVAALIALGAITAMKGLATGISTAFSTISSDLSSAVA